MKMKLGDTVYLQTYDLIFMMDEIPDATGVLDEALGGGHTLYVDPTTKYAFRFAISEPKNVRWVMSQDWLVNFDQFRETPVADLEKLHVRLERAFDEDKQFFNDRVGRMNHNSLHRNLFGRSGYDRRKEKLRKQEHQLESISVMIDYLRDPEHSSFIMPDKISALA